MISTRNQPQVWLAGLGPAPAGEPVTDDIGRRWTFDQGRYHTADNRHHQTPAELHARTNLVETS
jgi:hypothetical protein